MGKFKQRTSPWLPWLTVALLAGSCCVLAAMQYRWITEFAAAERDRMRADLDSRLGLLAANFNDDISNACMALFPDPSQIEKTGREKAYAARYQEWRVKQTGGILFKRIGIAIPHLDAEPKASVSLELLDLKTGKFSAAPWPAEWGSMHNRLDAFAGRIADAKPVIGRPGEPVPEAPLDPRASTLMEFPRFGESNGSGFHEQEWLIVELDESYVRQSVLPPLYARYLGGADYDTEITLFSDASTVIDAPSSGSPVEAAPDAAIGLLSVQPRMPVPAPQGPRNPPDRRGPPDRDHRRPPPRDGFGPPDFGGGPPDGHPNGKGRRGPPHDRDGQFRPPPDHRPDRDKGPGPPRDEEKARARSRSIASLATALEPPHSRPPRWRLYVRHRSGSLEAIAARARNRNIMISGGLLLLIVVVIGWLFRLSRQSARLAESHMNFVAGVSHELRTPLTVIRTAAFNLRGRMAARPDQVERYGKLIQDETEKLGALVEQVLQFASGEAGRIIREKEPVEIGDLIDESLQSNLETIGARGIQLEKRIDTDLPLVLADRLAMKHALQNLIENAIKYGVQSSGPQWLGLFASAITTSKGPAVEIRIADRGPGIPPDEQPHIFEAFFRGHRAVADQVHGTGLGLNLVRRIVEAHGATIDVHSQPQNGQPGGTEFIIRIPAAPQELSHEFAHSIS